MAVYPETPRMVYPVTITPRWKTLIGDMDSTSEQRRQLALFARYDASFHYDKLTPPGAQTLYDFYMARKGTFEPFWFFDPRPGWGVPVSHKSIYIGTGDGATTLFDLPGKSTSARTLYFDWAEQPSGFSYLVGGGDGGADRAQFTDAPLAGQIITTDFTGAIRIRCRYAVDDLPFELFVRTMQRLGLQLKGLNPA